MSNKVYDVLKFIAQIILPAVGTLYFALSSIWNLPYAGEIVGTVTAIDAFLGAVLGLSSNSYKHKEATIQFEHLIANSQDIKEVQDSNGKDL